MKQFRLVFNLLWLVLFFSACDTQQKVMKSTDSAYKYQKALEYYDKGDCYKASPIFEELMGVYKGTDVNENMYFLYASCQYDQRQFVMAAFHFKKFFDQFPSSDRAEEALFKHAASFDRLVEKPPLDQTYTEEALDAYQYFINAFPLSDRVQEANQTITKLRNILETKAMSAANQYYKTGNYRASAVTYKLILQDFPDIEESELCYFMIAKSLFLFAEKSIASKKAERYEDAIESCKDFVYRYPDSKYLEDVSKYFASSHYGAVHGEYEFAQATRPSQRISYINKAMAMLEKHLPEIDNQKYGDEINRIQEHLSFLTIKTHYQLAQESSGLDRKSELEKVIASYYIFSDKHKNSKYFKEAERIFAASRENLKKINDNG